MARWHMRDDDTSPGGGGITLLTVGLLAGLAAGGYLAHRFGGVSGISARLRRRLRAQPARAGRASLPDSQGDEDEEAFAASFEAEYDTDDQMASDLDDDEPVDDLVDVEDEDIEPDLEDDLDDGDVDDGDVDDGDVDDGDGDGDDEDVDDEDVDDGDGDGDDEDVDDEDDMAAAEPAEDFASADPDLEDRVLEAFVNDPLLRERAVDIGAIDAGTIELTGSVRTDKEFERATTIAGGVPGVRTVVNRVMVSDDDDEVGVSLEGHVTSQGGVMRDADEEIDDIDDIAERRRRRPPLRDRPAGGRTAPRDAETADEPANRQPPTG